MAPRGHLRRSNGRQQETFHRRRTAPKSTQSTREQTHRRPHFFRRNWTRISHGKGLACILFFCWQLVDPSFGVSFKHLFFKKNGYPKKNIFPLRNRGQAAPRLMLVSGQALCEFPNDRWSFEGYRQPRRKLFSRGAGLGKVSSAHAQASLKDCWADSGFIATTPMIGSAKRIAAIATVFIRLSQQT